MKHIYNFIIIFFLIAQMAPAIAQDPAFTQFYANPLYLNPAMAGTENCPRIVMNYRNQWPNLPGSFVTYSASFDKQSENLHGGFGVQVLQDNQNEGLLKTTSINAMYSYQLQVSRSFAIRAGFQATYLQKALDREKMHFGDEIHSRYGFIYETSESIRNDKYAVPDFSAGMLGFSKHFYAGFSIHHLAEPAEKFLSGDGTTSVLPRKYSAHAGATIPVEQDHSTKFTISPNIIYQQQAEFRHLNLGLYLNRGVLVGGLWYRAGDAIIALVGVQASKVSMAYSYDLTVSGLASYGAGSHELSLTMYFGCQERSKKKKRMIVPCPKF